MLASGLNVDNMLLTEVLLEMATLPPSAPATAATSAAPLDSTAPLCTSRQLDGRCRGLAPLLPEGGLRREEVRAMDATRWHAVTSTRVQLVERVTYRL